MHKPEPLRDVELVQAVGNKSSIYLFVIASQFSIVLFSS